MTVQNATGYRPVVRRKMISEYMHRFGTGLRESKYLALKVQVAVDINQASTIDELKPILVYLVHVMGKEMTCDLRD